jgi:hypothetical protein
MIKSAVVNDNTPCVDDQIKKEAGFYDGEKVSSFSSCKDVPKLSKVLTKEKLKNELEYPKPVQR